MCKDNDSSAEDTSAPTNPASTSTNPSNNSVASTTEHAVAVPHTWCLQQTKLPTETVATKIDPGVNDNATEPTTSVNHDSNRDETATESMPRSSAREITQAAPATTQRPVTENIITTTQPRWKSSTTTEPVAVPTTTQRPVMENIITTMLPKWKSSSTSAPATRQGPVTESISTTTQSRWKTLTTTAPAETTMHITSNANRPTIRSRTTPQPVSRRKPPRGAVLLRKRKKEKSVRNNPTSQVFTSITSTHEVTSTTRLPAIVQETDSERENDSKYAVSNSNESQDVSSETITSPQELSEDQSNDQNISNATSAEILKSFTSQEEKTKESNQQPDNALNNHKMNSLEEIMKHLEHLLEAESSTSDTDNFYANLRERLKNQTLKLEPKKINQQPKDDDFDFSVQSKDQDQTVRVNQFRHQILPGASIASNFTSGNALLASISGPQTSHVPINTSDHEKDTGISKKPTGIPKEANHQDLDDSTELPSNSTTAHLRIHRQQAKPSHDTTNAKENPDVKIHHFQQGNVSIIQASFYKNQQPTRIYTPPIYEYQPPSSYLNDNPENQRAPTLFREDYVDKTAGRNNVKIAPNPIRQETKQQSNQLLRVQYSEPASQLGKIKAVAPIQPLSEDVQIIELIPAPPKGYRPPGRGHHVTTGFRQGEKHVQEFQQFTPRPVVQSPVAAPSRFYEPPSKEYNDPSVFQNSEIDEDGDYPEQVDAVYQVDNANRQVVNEQYHVNNQQNIHQASDVRHLSQTVHDRQPAEISPVILNSASNSPYPITSTQLNKDGRAIQVDNHNQRVNQVIKVPSRIYEPPSIEFQSPSELAEQRENSKGIQEMLDFDSKVLDRRPIQSSSTPFEPSTRALERDPTRIDEPQLDAPYNPPVSPQQSNNYPSVPESRPRNQAIDTRWRVPLHPANPGPDPNSRYRSAFGQQAAVAPLAPTVYSNLEPVERDRDVITVPGQLNEPDPRKFYEPIYRGDLRRPVQNVEDERIRTQSIIANDSPKGNPALALTRYQQVNRTTDPEITISIFKNVKNPDSRTLSYEYITHADVLNEQRVVSEARPFNYAHNSARFSQPQVPIAINQDFIDNDNIVPGIPGLDYPTFSSIPELDFQCDDVDSPGFYADPEAGCQVRSQKISPPYLTADKEGKKSIIYCLWYYTSIHSLQF